MKKKLISLNPFFLCQKSLFYVSKSGYCMDHEKIQKQIIVKKSVYKNVINETTIYTNVNIFYIPRYSRECCNVKRDLQVQKLRERVSTSSIKILVHKPEGK